jgi:hypothetical protein
MSVQNTTTGVIYRMLTDQPTGKNLGYKNTFPSIEVKGGTINIYFSNEEAQPANAAAMTLDSASPLAEDVYPINIQARWILFELATGTPVIKANNLIGD